MFTFNREHSISIPSDVKMITKDYLKIPIISQYNYNMTYIFNDANIFKTHL